jgi:chromosomal replication initiation ATPase DnaA
MSFSGRYTDSFAEIKPEPFGNLSPEDLRRCREVALLHHTEIRKIVDAIGAACDVPVAHILSRRKTMKIAMARQLAMYVAVKAGHSRTMIGIAMNRDQSTVTHGYEAEKRRRGE